MGRYLFRSLRAVFLLLSLTLLLFIPLDFVAPAAGTDPPIPPRIMEAFPTKYKARFENRARYIANLPRTQSGVHPYYLIRDLNRWEPGHVVTVAFIGGTQSLYHDIESAAQKWAQYGNVQISFTASNGSYRVWSASDTAYSAEVRIAFDQDGYWSFVGRDSIDPRIAQPGEPSMSFEGFATRKPADWRATVLHEFGHALGFEHEHQNPQNGCDQDFRWDDDPGYQQTTGTYGQFVPDIQGRRPGIYTVLGGPPNGWDKAKVDSNLRAFPDSRAFISGPFDASSIMKYYFDAGMFRQGEQSHCYSPETTDLSPSDRTGIAAAYPRSAQEINRALAKRKSALQEVLNTPGLLKQHQDQLNDLLRTSP